MASAKENVKEGDSESKAICTPEWLVSKDDQLKSDQNWLNLRSKYESVANLPDLNTLNKVKQALEARKHQVTIVDSGADALALLTNAKMLPKGATVAFGGSITLEQIGFINAIKQRTDLKNYRTEAMDAMMKGDWPNSMAIRNQGMCNADVFYSSVSAITEAGEIVSADASGTRVTALTAGAKHVVLVVGCNKIVPDLTAALERLEKYIVPLESAHVRLAFNFPATTINNIVIVRGSFTPRYHIVLVKSPLGY